MAHRTRFLLFLFFVLLFCIITPLSILYTAGYQLNLSWPLRLSKALQKTGMFVFGTKPSGAKIYLDDKLQRPLFNEYLGGNDFLTTPAKLMHIIPGDYEVKLELDGYWPWEKKLTVSSGQSTHAEDIVLFKKILPAEILVTSDKNFSLSPDKKYLAAIQSNSVHLINLADGKQLQKKLNKISDSSKIEWAPNSSKFIINQFLFNLNDFTNPLSLTSVIGNNYTNIQWGVGDNNLYYEKNQKLYTYNFLEQSNSIIFNDVCDGYLINQNLLCLKNYNELDLISLSDKKIVKQLALPYSKQYQFTENNNFIFLKDLTHSIIFLINQANEQLITEEITQASIILPIDDNRLLYANNFEIWLYNIKNNSRILLSRISQPILGITWHPSNNYVIYTTSNNINALELDDREKRNLTELASVDELANPIFDREKNLIYFWAKINNEEGIYKLSL